MSDHTTFVARVLDGLVIDPNAEIQTAIDEWHASPTELDLPEWLGLSDAEYKLFVEQSWTLRIILKSKRYNMDLESLLSAATSEGQAVIALAARGASIEDAEKIVRWLKRTGQIA